MVHLLNVLFGLAAIAVLIGGAYAGYVAIDRAFARVVYTTKNAHTLLRAGNVSAWNAFRRLNPEWRPDLSEADFSGLALPEVDFQGAILDRSKFVKSLLDGANFMSANLAHVDFSESSLRRATFDDAIAIEARFDRANLGGASFLNANTVGAVYDGAIREPQTRSDEATQRPSRDLDELSPNEFERYVAQLLERLGYTISISPPGADRGVDMIAVEDTAFGAITAVVQVKRLSDPTRALGVEAVRVLHGIREIYPAELAILITNGQFSRSAQEYAAHAPSLRLIDGAHLADLAQKAG